MRKVKIANTIFMFFFGSVIGWIWEVICMLSICGVFAKRGVLHGPWLPIYGIGFLLIILLKKCVGRKPLLLFAASVTVCGCLEFVTSYLLEIFYHTRWWSYRNEVWNINGRVCLKSLLFFGIIGSLIVYGIVPIIDNKINKIDVHKKFWGAAVIMLLFMIDFVVSMINPNMGIGISEGI